ncbi:ADP-ribosylglycohydrolase family protein [Saccharopolyspora sp. K220]|uniref:ADP-ribosylglycohydrolase family protein n=1 Tax=Saccharopolyspora soli TaxID=2926618 RepID=UPI001F55C3D0|nr:ADP-ribosylglycohydrolase family protein [Saccharopolyspora soli]MCI2416142.1 ADP-ribosylglycohydrolase family protein [Saccharopolyspora soli]
MPHDPLSPNDLLADELAQRRESGYDIDSVLAALDGTDPAELPAARATELLDELEHTARRADWVYEEPDALDEIVAAIGTQAPPPVSVERYAERVHGAWQGRAAGCNLGKPVENGFSFTAASLRRYLELAGDYPIRDYIPLLNPLPAEFVLHPSHPMTTRGNIDGSARDDDLDYTVLGLHLLETYGPDYTTDDVAREWLQRLPFLLTYTAERAVYRNLTAGIEPERAATVRNPYREWIGAQIRADIHGYRHAGDPMGAAKSVFPDAALSHVGNGIYGAMWSAALVAAAFTADDVRRAVEISARCVPPQSRLAEALRTVLDLHAGGASWEQAQQQVEREYGHYSWVHTINNAVVVAMGVLWGAGDFTSTIGLTVQGAWDTDSNGATAGSVAGAFLGRDGIPEHWLAPLDDRLRSAVSGFDGSRISALAERTIRLTESGSA